MLYALGHFLQFSIYCYIGYVNTARSLVHLTVPFKWEDFKICRRCPLSQRIYAAILSTTAHVDNCLPS